MTDGLRSGAHRSCSDQSGKRTGRSDIAVTRRRRSVPSRRFTWWGSIMNHEDITRFAAGFRGTVIRTGDAGYDEARKLYNAMIDKRPWLIARCADVADVIAAVNFGRDGNLPIAIRGGGHNGPGFGSVDDGLVIDMWTGSALRHHLDDGRRWPDIERRPRLPRAPIWTCHRQSDRSRRGAGRRQFRYRQ